MTESLPVGYLAAGGGGRGVLVLHAWWGLNDTIRGVCDLLAAAGYTAFAPDLYHGEVTDSIAEAERLGSALDGRYPQARAEVAAAVDFLYSRTGGPLAVVGFSLGAFYALDVATDHPDHIAAVVVFYGSGVENHGASNAAYLGHFAAADPYEPAENVDHLEATLRQAGRPVTIYRYPGTGHWFFEPDRPQAYDEAAASLAWSRTLAFLAEVL